MSRLKYKTRGMSNPQGKPRVYFCCHREDFEKYFDEISNEILKLQNCSIWYLESDKDYDEAEHFLSLEQMQLFVMPVTRRLLSSENRALDREFKFAIEKHIPVLPLMQEEGLEELFNKKCGDLQFLDKNNKDETTISYEEKLKTYLSGVLIGDEVAEKIRAAFDAYVFLSYRKKDRRYAQELMSLIHRNDFCRDIAIWYDEFLTPGEDFNEAIRVALEKSGLFVLTVTPNLTNEINYIMTVEYPMAKKGGKPVLPVELVPTDKALLSEKYEDIPNCIDAHIDTELTEALLEAVKKMAIKENDGSAEHNFFIGLAYLGGVDVEVDFERALRLIVSASEAGLVEATDQLVKMYRSGLGVERNYKTAIVWQERKIRQLKKEYKKEPTEEVADTLFWEICDCGDYYKEEGKLSKAKEKYLAAKRSLFIGKKKCRYLYLLLGFFRNNLNEHKDEDFKYNLCVCYNKLGYIYQIKGNIKKAKKYYKKGLKLFACTSQQPTVASERSLAIAYSNLGDIYRDEGNIEKAKGYYDKTVEIFEFLVNEMNMVKLQQDLAIGYGKLGDISRAEKNVGKAKEYYEKALSIELLLSAEMTSIRMSRSLAVSYNNLGKVCIMDGNIEEAKECYRRSADIFESIADETESAEAKCDMAFGYTNLGDIGMAEKNYKSAKEYYEKALAIYLAVEENMWNVDARQIGVRCYHMLGDINKAEEDIEKAKEFYERSLSVALSRFNKSETIEVQRDITIIYNALGDVYMSEDDAEKAKEFYIKSHSIVLSIANRTKSAYARRDLANSYEKLGDINIAEKNIKAAKEYYEKALEIELSVYGEMDSHDTKRALCRRYNSIVIIYLLEENTEKAKHYCSKMLEIISSMSEKAETVEAKQDLSVGYNNLAGIYTFEGNAEKAKEYYQKAYLIALSIAEETDTIEARYELSVSCIRLGDMYKAERSLREAEKYYNEAYLLSMAIAKEADSVRVKKNLSVCCEGLGDIYRTIGSIEKAKSMYVVALEVSRAAAEKTDTDKNWDNVASLYYKLATVAGADRMEYLKKAFSIYEKLCSRYPEVAKYKESLLTLKLML